MGMLRLDWNVVATIVNLLILYWLMRKFLFKPVMGIMDKRKELIDQQFSEAQGAKEEAKKLQEQYSGLMANAKEESQNIVEKARENAKVETDNTLLEASEQAKRLLEQAREKMDMEREKMLKELESQISTLAMTAAGKIIGANASPKRDRALYDQFLSEAGEVYDSNQNDTDPI